MNSVHVLATNGSLDHQSWFQRRWIHGVLPWLVVRCSIGQITLVGAHNIPLDGPVLFIGRHRAGLMDGWVHAYALPRPTVFMVAARRMRHVAMRGLLGGIAVAGRRDGGSQGGNRAALAACRAELDAGRTMFVFPEGTSSLGPRHLQIEPGAALIARLCPAASIVPLDIHYITPCRRGTDVEIVAGPPFRLPAGSSRAEAEAAIVHGIERVSVDYPDAVAQRHAEQAARAAWRRGGSYAESLRGRPAQAPGAGRTDAGRRWIVWASASANAPVTAVAWLAGRLLADDANVVLFWQTMVAAPVQLLWSILLIYGLITAGWTVLAALYAVLMLARLAWPVMRHA